jgi:hypothetical protein
MIGQKDYLIDSNGNYVFFIEWIWNPTYIRMQLICYASPASAAYTDPKTGLAWVPLAPQKSPIVTLLTTNEFNNIVGFNNGVYGDGGTSDQIFTGCTPTKFSQAAQCNILCNLLYNPLKVPSDILYTFALSAVESGQLLTVEPSASLVYLPIKPGQYIEIVFTLVDQQYRPIKFENSNIVISCSIRKRPKLLD